MENYFPGGIPSRIPILQRKEASNSKGLPDSFKGKMDFTTVKLPSKKARGPKVEIIDVEDSITIRVTNHIYILSEEPGMTAADVITKRNLETDKDYYLPSKSASFDEGGKRVQVEFKTKLIPVYSEKEAQAAIEASEGAGLLARYKASYSFSRYDAASHSLKFGEHPDEPKGNFWHEVGHSLGYNERYAVTGDLFEPWSAAPYEGYVDDLMGTANDPLNQKSIDNLAHSVLDRRKLNKQDAYVGKPINFNLDEMEMKFRGQELNYYDYDPETRKITQLGSQKFDLSEKEYDRIKKQEEARDL